jgi:putative Mg2+ transporter-C (MgtC) family protein
MISIQDPFAALLGAWSSALGFPAVLLRVLLAFVLGAAIGCERANNRHSAGLRTFILVSVASAVAMLADCFLEAGGSIRLPAVSAATILGIAIISTSSISYSSKNQIKGLTTAVALWSCSIIGLAVGAGYYTAALTGYAALFICLAWLTPVELWLKDRSNHFEIHLELTDRKSLQDFLTILRTLGIRIDGIESNPAYINSGLSVYSISLTITGSQLKKYKTHAEVISALQSLQYVRYIEELK